MHDQHPSVLVPRLCVWADLASLALKAMSEIAFRILVREALAQ